MGWVKYSTVGATWGTDVGSRPTELTDGRVSAGLTSSGDVNKAVPQGQGGTGLTSNSTLLNTNTTKANVGLPNVEDANLATIRAGTLTGNLTGTIGGTANATVRSGAAAGATANQATTASILGGIHTGAVSGNLTGTIGGVANATVRSGAAAGATANQETTAAIRGGVTVATVTSGSNSHIWTQNTASEYAPSGTTQATIIEWRSGTGALLTTATITSTLNTGDNNIDVARSGSGVSFSGTTANIGAAGSTTIATYNSIKVSVFHSMVDMSGWTFKGG